MQTELPKKEKSVRFVCGLLEESIFAKLYGKQASLLRHSVVIPFAKPNDFEVQQACVKPLNCQTVKPLNRNKHIPVSFIEFNDFRLRSKQMARFVLRELNDKRSPKTPNRERLVLKKNGFNDFIQNAFVEKSGFLELL
ncbi:MAG: hypothetical protein Q4C95_03990 [Planctomycetia bacterium]|nr:hypothetical protein [Planctomycetia bacterium]